MYRVFFSHPGASGAWVQSVAKEFSRPPELAAYVAEHDLPEASDWLSELHFELLRCDALVAFIGPGFVESLWCDQEVGFALGRGKRVLPVWSTDRAPWPHGFMYDIQPITASGLSVTEVADRIFDCLYDDGLERRRLLPVVVRALLVDRDRESLRRWAGRLERAAADLTAGQRADVLHATTANSILRTDSTAYSMLSRAFYPF